MNFTRFYDANSTASGNIATGGPTKISLTDSMGPAAQVGIAFRFSAQWSLTASIASAKVKTNMLTSTGSIERRTEVDLRPVVFSAGLAYARFNSPAVKKPANFFSRLFFIPSKRLISVF